MPNRIALNWPVCSQIKTCIPKSREVCAQVRYYAVQSGNCTPTFWDNLSVPVSTVKKS